LGLRRRAGGVIFGGNIFADAAANGGRHSFGLEARHRYAALAANVYAGSGGLAGGRTIDASGRIPGLEQWAEFGAKFSQWNDAADDGGDEIESEYRLSFYPLEGFRINLSETREDDAAASRGVFVDFGWVLGAAGIAGAAIASSSGGGSGGGLDNPVERDESFPRRDDGQTRVGFVNAPAIGQAGANNPDVRLMPGVYLQPTEGETVNVTISVDTAPASDVNVNITVFSGFSDAIAAQLNREAAPWQVADAADYRMTDEANNALTCANNVCVVPYPAGAAMTVIKVVLLNDPFFELPEILGLAVAAGTGYVAIEDISAFGGTNTASDGSAPPPTPVLNAVTGLSAQVSGNDVILSWDRVDQRANEIRVFRSVDGGAEQDLISGIGRTRITWTNTGAPDGVLRYRVFLTAPGFSNSPDATTTVTKGGSTGLAKAVISSAALSEADNPFAWAVVTFGAVADATGGYALYRKATDDFSNANSVTDGAEVGQTADAAATELTDEFVAPGGGTFYYRVVARNTADSSRNSVSASSTAVVVPAQLRKPTIASATPSAANNPNANIVVTWNASPGASGYHLYRGASANFAVSANNFSVNVSGGNTTTYTDTSPGVGTHHYRVVAYDVGGNNDAGFDSDASDSVSGEVTAAAVRPPFGLTQIFAVGTVFEFRWSTRSGHTKYQISRSPAFAGGTAGVYEVAARACGTSVQIGTGGDNIELSCASDSVTILERNVPAGAVTYSVVAVDADGNTSTPATITRP
jgi:hypothetical protein